MPLTEFLRMSKEKAFTSDDTSCRPDNDCVELVWENGQITMQGQSSKARRGPNSNIFPTTVISKPQDNTRIGNGLKMTNKLSTMDSMLGDFSLPIPSYEGGGLDQDVEMARWLNYNTVEDSLDNEYTSDFLRELSGVTINDFPTQNHLAFREKKSGFLNSSVDDNMGNVKHGNSSKPLSSVEKHSRGESSDVPQFSLPFHNNFSRSGISGITENTTGKLDGGQPSTSSGITNFPYFSRPGFITRANHPTLSDSNRLGSDDKRCTLSSNSAHVDSSLVNFSSGCTQKDIVSHNQSLLAPVNANSESLPPMPREELRSSNQASVCQEDVTVKNNASHDQARVMIITKPIMAGERNKEPVVVATSSVCSGNSVERASNECARDLKRKSRETTESDGPSDEADEESIGARKAGSHRSGAKRGRAAEVHNLSERRRRDRINEKMRALQELIPNCNKVDKASMLDEAIEYLKTLQLQVQMLSMGAGMYMHPMMVPPGMQPIHGAQMPQFSPMGVGMGMGMGFGMNMLNVNSGMKLMPFQGTQYPVQGPQYPVPGTGPAFHVMGGSNLHPFGHPGQGLPMPMQRPPMLPVSGIPPLKMPVANVSGVAGATNAVLLGASSNPSDVAPQSIASNNAKSSVNPTSNQLTNEGIENPPQSHDRAQTVIIPLDTVVVATSRTDTIPS